MIRESQINFTDKQSEKENNQSDYYKLIKEKYLISRFVTEEKFGSQNIYQAAINLYTSLYKQGEVDKLIDPSNKFPERMDVMKATIDRIPEKIPDQEEFIAEFRRILTRDVNYGEAVSEATKKQLFDIMQKCVHTIIWTNGDTTGIPEKELPGSKEQLYRMGLSQFYNEMRKKVAQEKNMKHKDVMSVISSENKMEFIHDMIEKFLKMEIENVIIVEDRISNLENAKEIILENSNLEVLPILIQQEESRNKDKKEEKDFLIAKDFSDIAKLLENRIDFAKEKVGAIIDLDGVISNDEKRKDLQVTALIKSFREKGWI